MRHTLTPCPLLAHQRGRAEFTQSIITQAERCCHLGDAVSHIEMYDVRERVSQRHANTLPLALSQPPELDCERDATWMPIYSDKTQKAHRALTIWCQTNKEAALILNLQMLSDPTPRKRLSHFELVWLEPTGITSGTRRDCKKTKEISCFLNIPTVPCSLDKQPVSPQRQFQSQWHKEDF